MSEAFFTELRRALSARSVVLSAPASNSPSDGDRAMQTAISVVERCRKPVVVEIHGTCIGGGIDLLDGEVGGLVAACDIQCCSDASYFTVKEVDLALAVDLGSLQLLPAIVGYGNATDRAMTGRRVTGSEAKAMGSFPHDPHWRMGSQPLPQVQFLSLSRVNIQPLSARTIALSAPASDSPSNGDHAMQTAISAVEWFRKPVVVEIHHTCIGGGIDFLDGGVGGLFPSRSALEDGSQPLPQLMKISDKDIVEMVFFPVVNEACRVLDEGISVKASDLDIASIMGMGGGVMFWADSLGASYIHTRLEAWSK